MSEMEPVVLFACRPDYADLCALTVTLNCKSYNASTTQPKILKCRELIFTEPDVIATPSLEQENCFNIIFPKQLFKTGRLQSRLQSNNLVISQPYRVTPELYQACLRYTILAKLAPTWNKAGEWLIQGRDFLRHMGCANAVKFDLMAATDEQYISVCATVVRIKPLQLNDLDLTPLQVQSLLYIGSHSTGNVCLSDHWCHVLPSMKRGRMCSISLSIPKDTKFVAYKEIKRHWKNTYGYRLPETDEDLFFAQISFWGVGGKEFTVCLRDAPMQIVPRVDPKPILSAFLQDLHGKAGSVCSQRLQFEPQIRHTLTALYTSSQNVQGPGANLSRTSNTAKRQGLLRNMYSPATKQKQSAHNDMSLLSLKNSAPGYDQTMTGKITSNSTDMQEQQMSERPSGKVSTSGEATAGVALSEVQPECSVSSNTDAERQMPLFRTKISSKPEGSGVSCPSEQKRIVPLFKPHVKKTCLKEKQAVTDKTGGATGTVLAANSEPCSTTHISTNEPKSLEKHILKEKKTIAGKLKEKMICNKAMTGKSIEDGKIDQTLQPDVTTEFQNAQKRKLGSTNSSEVKRQKPQVSDVDVEMLAKRDQLGQVNVATLMSWLKTQGVRCKSKEKKIDLIERVKLVLALTSVEQ